MDTGSNASFETQPGFELGVVDRGRRVARQWNPRDIGTSIVQLAVFVQHMDPTQENWDELSGWIEASFNLHFKHTPFCERFDVLDDGLFKIDEDLKPEWKRLKRDYEAEMRRYEEPPRHGQVAVVPDWLVERGHRFYHTETALGLMEFAYTTYKGHLIQLVYTRAAPDPSGNYHFVWHPKQIQEVMDDEDSLLLHPDEHLEWDRNGRAIHASQIHCGTCGLATYAIVETLRQRGIQDGIEMLLRMSRRCEGCGECEDCDAAAEVAEAEGVDVEEAKRQRERTEVPVPLRLEDFLSGWNSAEQS